MLSIDEAIAHERGKAKYKKAKYDKCPTRMRYCCEMCFHKPKCNEVAEEHEQLAEWLEDYRRLLEFEKSVLANEDGYLAIMCERIGYNKAIDDFVEYVWETTSSSDIEWITRDYELYDLLQKKAEQLKVGGENGKERS